MHEGDKMKELTPHPQAHILRAIADGKTVQIRHEDDYAWWEPTDALGYINSDKHKFRIKPDDITINGHEVPCPAREPLEDGARYWVPDIKYPDVALYDFGSWSGDSQDTSRLKAGIIHFTKEAAIAHAEALLSFTRNDK